MKGAISRHYKRKSLARVCPIRGKLELGYEVISVCSLLIWASVYPASPLLVTNSLPSDRDRITNFSSGSYISPKLKCSHLRDFMRDGYPRNMPVGIYRFSTA